MKLSYEWLNEYLDLSSITPQELGEKMSRTGIEVDSVSVPGEGLSGLVVGRALEVVDHPDSDHLHVVTVDVAGEESLQIVCGAPNIAKGQKIIVATHGARIAGGHKIKRGKLRGVESQGMICSLQELGLPSSLVPKEDEQGIYVFEDDAIEVGMDAVKALALDSAIVELDITANRADALSMRGSVHEIGAIYNLENTLTPDEFLEGGSSSLDPWMTVSVEDEEDAPAYHLQIIKNVTVKPSPQWMQNRLIAVGVRPINNIVDVTNYVLMEYGQPLHAFDYDRLNSKQIHVRRAKDGETLVTLDGVERTLSNEIVITDGEKPVALAGVMGGLDSEIIETTTTVALESALFEPKAIRLASQKHNLRSESSSRFEKGINKATILQAGKRAAALIAELGDGEVVEGVASAQSLTLELPVVSISLERLNHVLGTSLSTEDVLQVFKQLAYPTKEEEGVFHVTVPAWRFDISIEADLVEEVGRIYGYDKIPSTLPTTASTQGGLTEKQRFVRWTRQFMQGAGLSQAYSYALTTPEKSHWFTVEERPSIRLDLPMSEDRSELRQSMLPSLLEALQYNVARSQQNVRLFEVGKVFSIGKNGSEDFQEREVIGAAVTGEWGHASWQSPSQPVDFFALKGVLEAYFAELNCSDRIRFVATDAIGQLHPGQTAYIYLGEELIGFIGKIHPVIQKELDLSDTFVFELLVEPLLAEGLQERVIQSVPKFPSMTRDIALLVPVTMAHATLEAVIKEQAGQYVQSVTLFDVYKGEHVQEGYQSLAYSIRFLNKEATLQEEEIKQAMDRIQTALVALDDVTIR